MEVWKNGSETELQISFSTSSGVTSHEHCNATATVTGALCLPELKLHEDATNVMYSIVEYCLKCD